MRPGNLLGRTAALCSLGRYFGSERTQDIITGLLDEKEPLLPRVSHPISSSHFQHSLLSQPGCRLYGGGCFAASKRKGMFHGQVKLGRSGEMFCSLISTLV